MRRTISIGVFVAALGLVAAGTRHADGSFVAHAQQQPQPSEIKIDNFSFGPAELTIKSGTTVTWTNHDDIPHTAVSTDQLFKSKVMDTDEKFSFTFTKPGTYQYFCSIHPKMTGKILVQ